MAKGIVLCQGDRTTCGGKITVGSAHGVSFTKPLAKEGDPVTCGKDGKTYRIIGGISFFTTGLDKKRVAGSVDSYSSCPCKAKILPSNSYPIYTKEELFSFPGSHLAATALIPALSMQNAQVEPEQYAQAAKRQSNFADTCHTEDNALLNGVYVWTETTNAGHAFVSVHENNTVSLYTYGRYGRTGPGDLTGDGILNFLQGADAWNYYRIELYRMGARAFYIDDADPQMTRIFFEGLWNNGYPAIQTLKMPDATRRRGHTIDKYDVTGSNCTTHSVEGIKFAGSKVFENGYKSITTQLLIEAEEDFTIPLSLQRYLVAKSSDMSSMLVVEMTNIFKEQYPNQDNLTSYQESHGGKLQKIAAESAASGGLLTPYSGSTAEGILGGSYDVDH